MNSPTLENVPAATARIRSLDEQSADHFSFDQQESVICVDAFEDALREAEARGRAVAVQEFSKLPENIEPVAYMAELATMYNRETGEYSGWQLRLSRTPFSVPPASIRGERPLADIGPYLRTIAALESLRPHWAEGYTSDGQAASAKTAALAQVWDFLGTITQTDTMQRLRDLREAASVVLNVFGSDDISDDEFSAADKLRAALSNMGLK